jgi:hypothetical protein
MDMALQPAIASFRDWMLGEFRVDGHYDGIRALEGPEAGGAALSVRLCTGDKSYYEARVDLEQRQLQVGFATEGRMINEAIEQMVLDSGGELDELLADELCDLGGDPLPMEHFFERPAFRYTVRLPLSGPEALEDAALRSRVRNVIRACRVLFQDSVDTA